MPQQPITNIKALTLLHFSLLVGQLMFAGIAVYLIYSGSFTQVFKSDEIVILVGSAAIGLSSALVITAFSMFKRRVEKIRINAVAVSEKLTAYRATSIIRWAMLEAPTILTIICFLLTGRYALLIIIAVLLIIFFYTKPTTFKVAQDLGIREEEVL